MRDSKQMLVGKIHGAHGVEGWLKVESFSDNPRRFQPGSRMYTEKGKELEIEGIRSHSGRMLVRFCGVEDRNAAELLRGLALYVPKSAAGELPPGSWYYWQLTGLQVYENGRLLGQITEVLEGAANDNYVLKKTDGREILIPALKTVIQKVDIAAGVMEVQLPPGLDE